MNKKFNFSINDGEVLFAHETSIHYGPTQFVLDFKSVTPRIDVRSNDAPVLSIKHNVILMEPFAVRELAGAINDMIKKYEKDFGKVEKPDAVKKLEKRAKKSKKTKEEPLAYLG